MENNHLYVLWTNADPVTAEHMVMLYTENALKQNWWDKVTVVIWGSTSKLVAENENIQSLIKQGQNAGVEYTGCIVCAKALGTVDEITELGIELKGWGKPLTELIKNREHMITV